MPRQPQYGQGAGTAISSDVYEQYAPQMAMTDFQTESARTGYLFQKDVEDEKQAQLDVKIAQNQAQRASAESADAKNRAAAARGKKVSSTVAGATLGAKLGSVVPGVGNLVGGAIGGLGGFLFGNEGGMVPEMNPRSMLFKEYQQGGSVPGYTGQGKFLRRGLQNLEFRQQDVDKSADIASRAGKYNFFDAALDAGRGYMMGKSLAPKAKSLMDLAGSSFSLAKNKGIGSVFDVLMGKAGGLPSVSKYQNIETIKGGLQMPKIAQSSMNKITQGSDFMDRVTGRAQLPSKDMGNLESLLANIKAQKAKSKTSPVAKKVYKPKQYGPFQNNYKYGD
tara:strand:- start:131 stop:1135 length:1005 start_codon:yes stop_codon:yes gene_type:complete